VKGSLEAAARDLADRVTSAVNVTVATVAVWEQPDWSLTIQGVSALRAVSGQRPVGSRIPLGGARCHERVFLEREPLVLHGESSAGLMSPEEAALVLAPNLQSIYLVPITFAGELVGILALGEMRAPKREPLDEHKQRRSREVLEEFMAASAAVWEARRLHRKLRAATSLLHLTPRVIEARSYGEVLSTLTCELAHWLGTPARSILYRLDQRDGGRVVGHWPELDGFTAEDESQILAAVARRSGEGTWPLGPVDVVDDPLDPLHPSVQPGTPLIRLDLPLQWNEELLGVACFYFREPFCPTTWDLEHLGHWGQIGALGMRLVSVSDAQDVEEQRLRRAACNFLTIHQPTVLGEVLTAVTRTVAERLETRLGPRMGSTVTGHDESRDLLDAAMREVTTALTGFREALVGGADEETTTVDVNDLARRAAEISGVGHAGARQKGPLRLRLELSRASEPLLALAAPGLLAVLVQVIDSAARHTLGGGEIEIRTQPDEDHVLVSIRDVESGAMPNVERSTLVQALSHEGTAGVALSLATAQAFAKRHGGVATCVLGKTGGTELVLRFRTQTRST
jgi:signal transduction histidine kinase